MTFEGAVKISLLEKIKRQFPMITPLALL